MFCQPYQMDPLEVSMKKLHPVKLLVMVKMCAENIATDLCFPVSTTKTSTFTSSLLCKDLVTQSLKNITINSNFNDIVLSVDIHMKIEQFRIRLLDHILTLYFRVRAFLFAKDVSEKHKAAHKALRRCSLRTDIKNASSSTVEIHRCKPQIHKKHYWPIYFIK